MWRRIILISLLVISIFAPPLVIESALFSRVVTVVAVCLILWLSEIVPPFVPTLILWALAPLLLFSLDNKFNLANVLSWAADPVLALFLGGFAVGVATEKYGLDKRLAQISLKASGKSFPKFLFF